MMAANALAIAAREIPAVAYDPSPARALVAEIRAGGHDANDGLAGALRENARARTALSNPKYPGLTSR
jgi:hypothetical protein